MGHALSYLCSVEHYYVCVCVRVACPSLSRVPDVCVCNFTLKHLVCETAPTHPPMCTMLVFQSDKMCHYVSHVRVSPLLTQSNIRGEGLLQRALPTPLQAPWLPVERDHEGSSGVLEEASVSDSASSVSSCCNRTYSIERQSELEYRYV